MLSFKFTSSDRRPIKRIDTFALVAEFEARGGTVRRFEPGETASYDSVKIYLLKQGYQLSMVRNMNCVKRVGAKGRGKAMHWSRNIALVDERGRRQANIQSEESSMKTWWERASTKQRLAQIDGGIECGMNSAQVAKNCGAAIYTNGNAVLSLAQRNGRHFPNIKSAAGLARIKRAAARTSFYSRAHEEISFPDAFSLFGGA